MKRSCQMAYLLMLAPTLLVLGLTAGTAPAAIQAGDKAKIPEQLLGSWVVTDGEQKEFTLEFRADGTMLGRLKLNGNDAIIKARVHVEGKKLRVTSVNPITEKEETQTLTIRTLTAREFVVEDNKGKIIKMEREKKQKQK